MRVLLVQSYLGGGEPLVYPIGLACLKAGLGGHDVRLLDTNTSSDPFVDLKKTIVDFRPDVVGISLRNIDSTNKRKVVYYYSYLKDVVNLVKESGDAYGVKIIIGGSGFSMFARQIMEEEPGVDYGVLLEGEITLPKLLDNLDSPWEVKSVFYRKDGKVLFSGAGELMDMDESLLPDRSALPIGPYMDTPEAVGIEAKRGCILNCIYCIYGFLNGKKIRLRDPKTIVDEIEKLKNEQGLRRFTFVDSVFNIPADHSENICREILKRGLDVTWSAWFNEKTLTEGSVKLAREAGCRNFILSPDGFSDISLKMLGKNIKKEDILNSYSILRDLEGFEVSYNFFKNPPGQSLGTFVSLMAFYFRAKRQMGRRVHFEFNSMRIEPHTRLFELALAEGAIEREENLLYPRYYSNKGTRYIDGIFNLMLRMKGK